MTTSRSVVGTPRSPAPIVGRQPHWWQQAWLQTRNTPRPRGSATPAFVLAHSVGNTHPGKEFVSHGAVPCWDWWRQGLGFVCVGRAVVINSRRHPPFSAHPRVDRPVRKGGLRGR